MSSDERNVTFKLFDVFGKKVKNEGSVEFFCVKDGVTKTKRFVYESNANDTYLLPQFPQAQMITADALIEGFQVARSLTNLANKSSDSITLIRNPKKWTAKFESWNVLESNNRFDRLTSVLKSSLNINIEDRGVLTSFTDNNYDNLSGEEPLLAKACLLNLYARLTDIKSPIVEPTSWFSFVKSILSINRERFIAIVEKQMYDIVSFIAKNDDAFLEYEKSGHEIHFNNIPNHYKQFVKLEEMISIKSADTKGNIQLTLSISRQPTEDVYILDADIDENSLWIDHLIDLIKHKFTGGTHPYEIHEYIKLATPQVDLGYQLEPKLNLVGENNMFEEEYIYLAGLTHNTALIAWGKFFFDNSGKAIDQGAKETIGARSDAFAQPHAKVSITNLSTNEERVIICSGGNFCLAKGLTPDTKYKYKIEVPQGNNLREWASHQHRTYDLEKKRMVLPNSSEQRRYDNQFETFPDPQTSKKLKFIVMGDFGKVDKTQMKVAKAMEKFADDVRFIITTGDNIYSHSTGSGEHDDDWFDSFFQPYRYIINKIPVFPSMGNHDNTEHDESGQGKQERRQIYENFYLQGRFGQGDVPKKLDWENDSGLFYKFQFGKDAMFICMDTSEETREIDGTEFSGRLCTHERNLSFVEKCFDQAITDNIKWCIPFSHHPAYSQGNTHGDTSEVWRLVDRIRNKGLRVMFSGHDHNFQYLTKDRTKRAKEDDNNSTSNQNTLHCFLTGGGAEPRSSEPRKSTKATLKYWGGTEKGHFLVVTIDGNKMTVEAIDEDETLLTMKDRTNGNREVKQAIVVDA
ncbi:MAG: metallophosphoesterase [Blastocatellia bacterium]